jgi:hypothetical protein
MNEDFKTWCMLTGIFVAGMVLMGFICWLIHLPVVTSTLKGRVVTCTYHAAYTTVVPVSNGKTTTYTTVHHPAHWDCRIEADSTTFPATLYEPMREGDRVMVRYHVHSVVLDNAR